MIAALKLIFLFRSLIIWKKKITLDIGEMKKAIDEARPYCEPRGLVLINPGNPTGETYVCNHGN